MRAAVPVSSVWSFLAVGISPVVGLLLSLGLLVSRAKPSHFGLAFSLALIYSYFPVAWDARNNFLHIYLNPEGGLNLYTISLLTLNTFGIPYIQVVAIFGFLVIYIFSIVIVGKLHKRSDYSHLRYFVCLLLFVGCLEFRNIYDIQKTTLALAVFLLAIDVQGRPFKITLFVLSALIHSYTLSLAALIPIAYILKNSSRTTLFILFAIATILGAVMTPELAINLISYIFNIPPRLAHYLSLTESRFSTETVALIVFLARVFALEAVALVCILQLEKTKDNSSRHLLNLLVACCLLALIFSRNEVLIERFFLAATILSAYVAVQVKFKIKHLIVICAAIMLNVGMHGINTLIVIYGERYTVIGTQAERIEMSMKLLYLPTPLLVSIEENGYSDIVLWGRVTY